MRGRTCQCRAFESVSKSNRKLCSLPELCHITFFEKFWSMRACCICSATLSGSAEGKSTLLSTGTMASSCSYACGGASAWSLQTPVTTVWISQQCHACGNEQGHSSDQTGTQKLC